MRPAARKLAVALAGMAALAVTAAMPVLGTEPAGAAGAGLPSRLGMGGRAGAGAMPVGGRGPAGAAVAGLPSRLDVGGARLASSGVVVGYPARGAQPLPRVPAVAYVIADASTGQVLAAKDAHGEFPPASTLKVLTAITLIPRLSPNAMVVASRQATSVQPNVVGLITGRRYKVSGLFTALLTDR